jgi:Casein kinase II regulatory subunit
MTKLDRACLFTERGAADDVAQLPTRRKRLSLTILILQFQDDFNLTGLGTMVPYYEYALDMVLDVEMPMEDSLTEEQQEIVESAAEMLYGLIHARCVASGIAVVECLHVDTRFLISGLLCRHTLYL